MSNPSGTVYLQANQSYVWQDGDVYQIPQGDTTEGAAQGASFSGLGVDNQPHQFLLNKINWLKRNQATATSNVGVNGWYKISSQDANLGQIQIIEQWGVIPAATIVGVGSSLAFTFNFSLAFTTACWDLVVISLLKPPATNQANATQMTIYPTVPTSPPPGSVFNLLTNQIQISFTSFNLAQITTFVYGVGWRALGY